jgi:hypothetical protein
VKQPRPLLNIQPRTQTGVEAKGLTRHASSHLSRRPLLSPVAGAMDEDRVMHVYRGRNQLILSDDVDIDTQIEVASAGL